MTMKRLLALLLLAPAAFAADLSGRFEPGTNYEAPLLHAPATVSRMFARTVPRMAGQASVELPASGDGSMIIVTSGRGARLTTPTGTVLRGEERASRDRGLRRFDLESTDEVLHVMRTTAASYRLDLDIPANAPEATVVAAEPESAITLSSWAAPLSRQPGQPVTLRAELRDGDDAIVGASVTARLASPRGQTFDVVALQDEGDGSYTATLSELPQQMPGPWQIRFDADGVTEKGVRFARTGGGELVAERGAARLGAPRLEIAGTSLRVSVPADIAMRGNYRLDVIVARDGKSLAWAEGARNLATGATTLSIDIPLEDVGNAEGLFVDVRLLGLDELGVAGRVTN